MAILIFFIELMAAVMLLLYAVRMVRTGIERAFGPSFKQALTHRQNRVGAATTGLVLSIILQSSAAVALLVSGFFGAGSIAFGTGLAVVLGADLGSALLIQVLSFDLSWLTPVLLAIGGGLFVKSERRAFRQAGRIFLGIAFILLSLQFLRDAMEPIRDSAFLPAIADYLTRDLVTAFIIGCVLAFVMHSSVAAILMCVAMVSIQAISVEAGVSLVLGANMGSAMIPVWLTRAMGNEARRIPVANLALRGSGAILALLAVNLTNILPQLGPPNSAQTLINAHILFNALLLTALILVNRLEAPLTALLPDEQPSADQQMPIYRSTLDDSNLDRPHLAIATLKREVLRMVQLVETMMTPVIDLYSRYNEEDARQLTAQDAHVNTALDEVRRYAAELQGGALTKAENKRVRELTEYAIALETAGDIVAKRLVVLAKEKKEQGIKFSESGEVEVNRMHRLATSNMMLASNLLVSDDLESARLLLEEKQEMARLERKSRKQHLKRLRDGVQVSFDSSDIHLETVANIREFNSQIASVAYPILYREGQLLETRLIEQDLKELETQS